MKLKVTIEIDYDTNGETEQTLRNVLHDMVHHAADNGMFTNGTDAEVFSWNAEFEKIN